VTATALEVLPDMGFRHCIDHGDAAYDICRPKEFERLLPCLTDRPGITPAFRHHAPGNDDQDHYSPLGTTHPSMTSWNDFCNSGL